MHLDPSETILDHPTVLRVMFHPRRSDFQSGDGTSTLDFHLPVTPRIRLGSRLFIAAPDAPLILYFHGNGEIAADYDGIAPAYTGMGVSLMVVDFRGYGHSDGAPSGTALLTDALAVYQNLSATLAPYGIRPPRVYVMGRSLGSASALEIAAHGQPSPAGLILESGFAHTIPLLERLGCQFQGEVPEELGFGNLEKMRKTTIPTLIIHGEEDWIIPVTDGHTLAEQSPAQRKKLLIIPGAGHNDLMIVGIQAYFQSIGSFVHDPS
ncbi:MAG: alpha/beta hydrolase [Magnetococcales bacterium]|nr:alpha/beta hydrolase [Magnetococcales bacterium]MBF0322099.1 alpha/beta hydrolase [Magnetococcales bacterium]